MKILVSPKNALISVWPNVCNLQKVCLGGLTTGVAVAWNCVKSFLATRFSGAERHRRRLAKVSAIRTDPTVVYGIAVDSLASEASGPTPKEQ